MKQKLYMNVWLPMAWTDKFLTWDSNTYENIEEIIVSADEFWKPELTHYTSYSSDNLDSSCTNPKGLISKSGTVSLVPSCHFNAVCSSDFTNWPYDIQNCTLKFSMWVDSSNKVKFTPITATLGDTETNSTSQWKIRKMSWENAKSNNSPDRAPHPIIIYNFIIERHSGIHSVFIITPAFGNYSKEKKDHLQ